MEKLFINRNEAAVYFISVLVCMQQNYFWIHDYLEKKFAAFNKKTFVLQEYKSKYVNEMLM